EKYGRFGEKTLNLVMPGLDGLEKMAALMAELRANPPADIAGTAVLRMRDYKDGSVNVPGLGKVENTPMSGSNVLYFELEDGCSFIVRPSGTEPKIKIYILAQGKDAADVQAKIEKYNAFAETLKR
ncbi:MAG: phospho-sugar mutase, partial [Oscillospiraceae bacterium]|nr:phospho-sugar mutase [Oscillospiraceae bacterium]